MILPDMEHLCSVLGIILLALAPLLLEGAPPGAVDGNIRQFYMYRLDITKINSPALRASGIIHNAYIFKRIKLQICPICHYLDTSR